MSREVPVSDVLQLPCAACGGINRLPAGRLGQGRCGRCHEPLYHGRPLALDEAGFDRFLTRCEPPLLVDFWAAWCGPCRMMAPVFEQVAGELAGRLVTAKVDTEQAPAVAARLGIRSIPTLALFRDGGEVARVAGAMDRRALTGWLDGLL